jgi:GT2 family glycosyltransferase
MPVTVTCCSVVAPYARLDVQLEHPHPAPARPLAPGARGVALLATLRGRPLRFLLHDTGPEGLEPAALERLLAGACRFDLVAAAVEAELTARAPAPAPAAVRWGPTLPGALPTGAHVELARRCDAEGDLGAERWAGDPLGPWRHGRPLPGPHDAAPEAVQAALRAGGAVERTPALATTDPVGPAEADARAALRDRAAVLGRAAGAAWADEPAVRPLALRFAAGRARALLRPGADRRLPLAELAGAVPAFARARRAARAGAAPAHPRALTDAAADAVDVLHVDLASDPLPALPGDRPALVVLWCGDVPLGHVRLGAAERGDLPALAPRVARAVAPGVGARLFATGFERPAPSRAGIPASDPPPLADLVALTAPLARVTDPPPDPGPAADTSIVICTRGRPDDLAVCLDALGRLAVRPLEVVVVDNDPADPRTAAVVARFPGVRLVPEPRPGLSAARNAGVRAARGAVIAFVDDDVTVHPRWLDRLLRGFTGPEVVAVTGLVLPAALDTRARVVFEAHMGSIGRGHQPMAFDARFFGPQVRTGVPVWAIGAGANMAVRNDALEPGEPFDERLGAGATGCSEDSELWYRLLARGGEARYVPDAVVDHGHRRDLTALHRQAHDYLRGHVASLFVQHARHGHPGNLYRALVTVPAHLLHRAVDEALAAPAERTGVLGAEVRGYLAGLREWRLALRPGRARRRAGSARPARARTPRPASAPPPRAAHAAPAR